MSKLVVVALPVVVVTVLSWAAPALTCGPDFPHELLRDRKRTMVELVEGTFDWEAAHLVQPPAPAPRDGFVVHEYGDDELRAQSTYCGGDDARYRAGADAWHSGDLVKAEQQWQRLLALPREARMMRSTWAAFMLGRHAAIQGHTEDAANYFALTRALAVDGFRDELGLAAASFGEEAHLHLHVDDVRAIRLYAQQAALGSESGRASLLFVARQLLNDDDRLDGVIRDPVAQRLVASYLFARSNEPDAQKLERVLRVIEKRKLTHVDAADRLAAVAYRAGKLDVARRFAQKSDAPLALWVRAKLALRAGDVDGANELLARAARAFPVPKSESFYGDDATWGSVSHDEYGGWETISPHTRVQAERAVLALSRQDYVEALRLLLIGGNRYWRDAAYVAERVLTLDELLAFVDVHARHPEPIVRTESGGYWEPSARHRLRALTARRLMRAGQWDRALTFFDESEHRARAADYARFMRAAADGADGVDKARAMFDGSVVLRRHGLEIVGYELDPDWAVDDGNFDHSDTEPWDEEPLARGDFMVPQEAYSSFDERGRVASSVARPLSRWHYRMEAAQLAASSAQHLPPRSQAYAAVLCRATSWVIDQQPELAQQYWRQYVDNGAAVDFAGNFGRSCPAPDFEAAAEGRLSKPQVTTLDSTTMRATASAVGAEAANDALAFLALMLLTRGIARRALRRLFF